MSASPASVVGSPMGLGCWNTNCPTYNPSSFLGCSRCANALYCGRDCQHADWKRHKVTCVPTLVSTVESFNRLMASAMSDQDFSPLLEFIDSLNANQIAIDMRSAMISAMVSAGLIGTALQVISALNVEMQPREIKKVLNLLVSARAFAMLDEIGEGCYGEYMTNRMAEIFATSGGQISRAKADVSNALILPDQMQENIYKARKQIDALSRYESFKGKMDETVQELFTGVDTLPDVYERGHSMRSSASSSFIRNAYIFELLQKFS